MLPDEKKVDLGVQTDVLDPDQSAGPGLNVFLYYCSPRHSHHLVVSVLRTERYVARHIDFDVLGYARSESRFHLQRSGSSVIMKPKSLIV